MIGMRMRAHDPTNATFGRFQNCVGVRCIFGAGIDHEYFVVADEVRVCSEARHVAGIRCGDSTHERRNGLRLVVHQRRFGSEGCACVSHEQDRFRLVQSVFALVASRRRSTRR